MAKLMEGCSKDRNTFVFLKTNHNNQWNKRKIYKILGSVSGRLNQHDKLNQAKDRQLWLPDDQCPLIISFPLKCEEN